MPHMLLAEKAYPCLTAERFLAYAAREISGDDLHSGRFVRDAVNEPVNERLKHQRPDTPELNLS